MAISATGTNIYYGPVTLRNVLTRHFEQTPINDESGTDKLFDKFLISIECVANYDLLGNASATLGIDGASGGGSTAAAIEVIARKVLGEHRHPFRMEMNSTIVLQATPATANGPNIDANNGPKVIECSITNVSPKTLRIRWTVEVCIVDCVSQPSPVLNNRWSVVDDVQEDFHTVRYWQGVLRVSSFAFNPHMFRGLVFPVLYPGWKRKAMHFHVDREGLNLGYRIVDEEMVGPAPPFPATKMRATHSETLTDNGAKNVGTVAVRLDAPNGVDKRYLLQLAVSLIVAKLQLTTFTQGKGIYRELTLVDHIGDDVNAVEARAIVERLPDTTGSQGQISMGAAAMQTIGRPLDGSTFAFGPTISPYDPDFATLAGPWGTTNSFLGLFLAALQSPCTGGIAMPQIAPEQPESGNDGQYGSGGLPEPVVTEGPINNFIPPNQLSTDQQNFMYLFCTISNEFFFDENSIAMPVAKAKDDEDRDDLAVVRLAGTTAKRVIRYAAERIGDWPTLWKRINFTDAAGIKNKILGFMPTTHPPELLGDGQVLYKVEAVYTYAMLRTPLPEDQFLSAGSLPWDTSNATQNLYPNDHFVDPEGDKGLG